MCNVTFLWMGWFIAMPISETWPAWSERNMRFWRFWNANEASSNTSRREQDLWSTLHCSHFPANQRPPPPQRAHTAKDQCSNNRRLAVTPDPGRPFVRWMGENWVMTGNLVAIIYNCVTSAERAVFLKRKSMWHQQQVSCPYLQDCLHLDLANWPWIPNVICGTLSPSHFGNNGMQWRAFKRASSIQARPLIWHFQSRSTVCTRPHLKIRTWIRGDQQDLELDH